MEFLCGSRHGSSGAILPGIEADCAEQIFAALCRMSSSDQIAGRGVPRPFAGSQAGNRGSAASTNTAERRDAMHQTAHCQEVHA